MDEGELEGLARGEDIRCVDVEKNTQKTMMEKVLKMGSGTAAGAGTKSSCSQTKKRRSK